MGLVTLVNAVKTREKGGAAFTLEVPRFEVERGEFIGIIGPSGCGKSTFLDLLGLVLRCDSAERFLFKSGERATDLFRLGDGELASIRRRHIGYILQSGGLLPFLDVRDNILLTAALARTPAPERSYRELVERLGIASQAGKKPQFLSGGQRQRVAIARAMIHRPALILADEPTASVDHPTAMEIVDTFFRVAKDDGRTVVMVTHDTETARRYSDRIYSFRVEKRGSDRTVSTMEEL